MKSKITNEQILYNGSSKYKKKREAMKIRPKEIIFDETERV
jgi:hypothetical protein